MELKEHVTDLLPAYALMCLDEADAVLVRGHLAGCPACRAELLHYQALADRLPLAAPQVDPPARVKQALMSRIEAFASGNPSPQARPSRRQILASWARRAAPTWSLVSVILVLALAASNLLLWRQVNPARGKKQPMQVINLSGTGSAPVASALLVISQDGQHGTLVVDELPNLTDQQQYQLWLIDGNGQRTSGGVFSVKDGYGSLWVASPRPLNSYPAFGVTIEPWGGSPAPTGEKVLGGEL